MRLCFFCPTQAVRTWIFGRSSHNGPLCAGHFQVVTALAKSLGYGDDPFIALAEDYGITQGPWLKDYPFGSAKAANKAAKSVVKHYCDCGVQLCYTCGGCTEPSRECSREACDHLCGDCGAHTLRSHCFGCGKCAECDPACSDCGLCSHCCERCGGCGECLSAGNCVCNDEADVAVGVWKLPPALNLREAAARFYTLLDRSLEQPDIYRGKVEAYAAELADIFARYLDMAVGGEIRYGSSQSGVAREAMPRIVHDYTKVNARDHRGRAWLRWHELRQEYGISILTEAENALMQEDLWREKIGGPAWGAVAQTLRLYEEGVLNDIMFVDTAFGLEHNNGCVFDKLWITRGLKAVLDANLKGDLERVAESLPEDEQREYLAWRRYGQHAFKNEFIL